jgi:hypothetical protein
VRVVPVVRDLCIAISLLLVGLDVEVHGRRMALSENSPPSLRDACAAVFEFEKQVP